MKILFVEDQESDIQGIKDFCEEKGYLYVINEPVIVGKDIYQHPRTTMDENAEFLTSRTLKVKVICEL